MLQRNLNRIWTKHLTFSTHYINTSQVLAFRKFRAHLLPFFKQRFSMFKQHYTYFYILFHSHAGTESGLGVKGAVLLLAICSDFGFWLYCLAGKGFLLLLFFFYVCRVCLLLVRKKLFCLKFFKGLSCLFLVKLVYQSQFFFQLCYCLLVIFFVRLIFWACIFFCFRFQIYKFFYGLQKGENTRSTNFFYKFLL